MTTTQTPPLEDDVKAIRDALAAVPKGWHNLDATRPHPEDEGVAEVGALDGDGAFSGVFTVDCGNYFAPDASLPLAQFYAACHPARIARLLAHIDAQAARLEVAEDKARLYERLRKFSPREFQSLWTKNVTSGAMFDDLVRAAIASESAT